MTDKTHWGYGEDRGPQHWGELDPTFALCGAGHSQSPIDLQPEHARDEPGTLHLTYGETALCVLNNGHSIRINVEPGSALTYRDRRYDLLQFHFHHPSEHTRDGAATAMEVHFVHRAASGGFAVLGAFIVPGEEQHAGYAPIFRNLPAQAGEEIAVRRRLSLPALLPATERFYAYGGSLTTPPCSEGVQWLMLEETVALSQEQIAAFKALYPHNARPVQPHNGRDVLHCIP